MKNGRLKYSISYIFLVLFLSMKMAGLHVLSHTDDKDHALHCMICDQAITHNLTPAISPEVQDFVIENTEFFVQAAQKIHYSFMSCGTIATDQLFSRPPPFLS
ncbi:hypothetical protein HCG49_01605 [Arenibacter sp. 6A1]|nr:hypothetical protein [Arenibacter sp. 6A1]